MLVKPTKFRLNCSKIATFLGPCMWRSDILFLLLNSFVAMQGRVNHRLDKEHQVCYNVSLIKLLVFGDTATDESSITAASLQSLSNIWRFLQDTYNSVVICTGVPSRCKPCPGFALSNEKKGGGTLLLAGWVSVNVPFLHVRVCVCVRACVCVHACVRSIAIFPPLLLLLLLLGTFWHSSFCTGFVRSEIC